METAPKTKKLTKKQLLQRLRPRIQTWLKLRILRVVTVYYNNKIYTVQVISATEEGAKMKALKTVIGFGVRVTCKTLSPSNILKSELEVFSGPIKGLEYMGLFGYPLGRITQIKEQGTLNLPGPPAKQEK